MNRKILIASNNQGKLRELTTLLNGLKLDLLTPDEFGVNLDVPEDGKTYEENARIKARAFCLASGLPSLADDTGLEVAALNGAPGLHSARFVPQPGADDSDRRLLLLTRLQGKPQPWKARFVCAVVLAIPDGRIFSTFGQCEGEITKNERGESGFGYDRVFLFPSLGKTMAELSMLEKNKISHRAKAVQAIIPHIMNLMG